MQRHGSGISLLLNAIIDLDEGLAPTRTGPAHVVFRLNVSPHWSQDVWGVRADAELPESLLHASTARS